MEPGADALMLEEIDRAIWHVQGRASLTRGQVLDLLLDLRLAAEERSLMAQLEQARQAPLDRARRSLARGSRLLGRSEANV